MWRSGRRGRNDPAKNKHHFATTAALEWTVARDMKLIEWLKKRRARKACGMHCGTCPFLKSHWNGMVFNGLSCRRGLW